MSCSTTKGFLVQRDHSKMQEKTLFQVTQLPKLIEDNQGELGRFSYFVVGTLISLYSHLRSFSAVKRIILKDRHTFEHVYTRECSFGNYRSKPVRR